MSKLSDLTPVRIARGRLHRKVFQEFADHLGFVYFGLVNQQDDEHRLIRGLTLSPTHHDDHYTIGSYHSYDIAICERTDVIKHPGHANESKKWLIVAADLHKSEDLPHTFIGLTRHNENFYRHVMTKFSYLQKLEPGMNTPYDLQFRNNFAMYATPSHFIEVERLFGGQLNEMLVQHFPHFSFEIANQVLYVYAENTRPTSELLSRMLQCAAWLANELDRK